MSRYLFRFSADCLFLCLLSNLLRSVSCQMRSAYLTEELSRQLVQWAAGLRNPTFVYWGQTALMPCSGDVNVRPSADEKAVWIDFRRQEVFRGRFRIDSSTGELVVNDAQFEDSGKYVCQLRGGKGGGGGGPLNATFFHHLVVYRMPSRSLDIIFFYNVPTCREDRLKQRMDTFKPRFKVWPARHDEYRIAAYSCVPMTTQNEFQTPESIFTFVISHTLARSRYDILSICDVECMKKVVLDLLLAKDTIAMIERWILIESMNSTNTEFPEFRYDITKSRYELSTECQVGHSLFHTAICLPCRPGTYYEKDNGTCFNCSKDSFQTNFARSACRTCPLNGTTDHNATYRVIECKPLNPLLRLMPFPYMIFICLISSIVIVNCLFVYFKMRFEVNEFLHDIFYRKYKVPKKKKEAHEDSLDAIEEMKFLEERTFVRVGSTLIYSPELLEFVATRRKAKEAQQGDALRITQAMEIPDKRGIMNMVFEKYQPAKSMSRPHLASDFEPPVPRDRRTATGDATILVCTADLCSFDARPMKYPLPWTGFAEQPLTGSAMAIAPTASSHGLQTADQSLREGEIYTGWETNASQPQYYDDYYYYNVAFDEMLRPRYYYNQKYGPDFETRKADASKDADHALTGDDQRRPKKESDGTTIQKVPSNKQVTFQLKSPSLLHIPDKETQPEMGQKSKPTEKTSTIKIPALPIKPDKGTQPEIGQKSKPTEKTSTIKSPALPIKTDKGTQPEMGQKSKPTEKVPAKSVTLLPLKSDEVSRAIDANIAQIHSSVLKPKSK